MKIYILIGTRPNFIKVTRFKEVAEQYPDLSIEIIHTGQHYDRNMSEVFFEQFGLKPDHFLNVESTSVVSQFASIMMKLEQLINQIGRPDWLIVPGDVNSTLAGALTANKMGIKLGHLESGLRSFDHEMPEEINRILTDKITDVYFVTEKSGLEHLKSEGVEDEKVQFVGNTMIDTLVKYEADIDASQAFQQWKLVQDDFLLITLHRPSNVDTSENQERLISMIKALSEFKQSVFPIHPRTKNALIKSGRWGGLELLPNLILLEPLGYFEFQNLVKNCFAVVTDSGGIQEETTYRKKPCFTLRENTERPITIDIGTNELLAFDVDLVLTKLKDLKVNGPKKSQIPPHWDGKTTERILSFFMEGQ